MDKSPLSTSLWTATAKLPDFPTLTENLQTDVCIVGAGIAGLTTAYLLLQEGKSVVVLDDGKIGGGMTGQTSAHLSSALDDKYFLIEKMHGEKGARIAAESHAAAIRRIEAIVISEEIDCDFEWVDAYLFAPPGESTEELDQELEAARQAGLEVERLGRAPIKAYDTGPCLRFSTQAQFHPLKYIAGLAAAIKRKGGRIFTGTHAEKIKGGQPALVTTTSGKVISAGAIVVATNSPVNDLVVIHTKQAPYTTYVLAARIPRNSVTKALYYDTIEAHEMPDDVSSDSYHYVRVYSPKATEGSEEAEHDYLIVGGRDHKTGQEGEADKRYAQLESWARERWPELGETVYKWAGQVMEPVDAMAFIGPNPMDDPNVFIITGDSGNGLTHGTIGGILLTDLIMERCSPWAELYNPSRINFRAAGEFSKENLNVVGQMVKGYVAASEIEDETEVRPGEGALMRSGLKKIAVFKDMAGVVHKCSAVCPHLGCVVAWNNNDKTWDCPCHGSRFDSFGVVINGPANENLQHEE